MKFAKILLLLGTLFLAIASSVGAQDRAALQQKLTSQYALTKTTADKSDIVTAGAILVLKKDNLMMVDVNSANVFQNTYKGGKITQNALGKISRFHMPGLPAAPSSGAAQRTFVAGEKMWVTGIEVKDNGIQMLLYTDAINDVRYGASLFFPIKGSQSIDEAEKMVAEVFDVQPPDDSAGNGQQQTAADSGQPAAASEQPQPAAAATAAPPPPIAPPPPPADEQAPAPKTISLGQTEDVVVANFGKPDRIAKIGKKEIYYYKDMKVTFVNGKVTDVE
ncbi:MAG TPA: hypothetical protein VMF66_18155 [Candidatus Acidoferrum sp.]|nr:hypothetical protein [Candidatus Acidoferrum sp.]